MTFLSCQQWCLKLAHAKFLVITKHFWYDLWAVFQSESPHGQKLRTQFSEWETRHSLRALPIGRSHNTVRPLFELTNRHMEYVGYSVLWGHRHLRFQRWKQNNEPCDHPMFGWQIKGIYPTFSSSKTKAIGVQQYRLWSRKPIRGRDG